MQDDVTPGWAKKKKAKPTETSDPLDTPIGGEPDIIIDEPEQVDTPTEETVDEKRIEEEYGPPPESINNEEVPEKKPAVHKRPFHWFKKLSKAQKIVYSTLFVLVLAVGAFVAYMLLRDDKPIVVPSKPVYRAPTPTTVPSTLTGLQVDPSINKLQVTGVMIENSVFARPQSGLNQAGIVYEAIAEAGITRFMALFQDTKSEYIGPVRSVRPYYIQWCQAYDCALAHVGGSPEALNDLKKYNVKNLDQFAGGSYFGRISSRYAPHNMYTSQAKLSQYEQSRGYTSSSYTGFEHLLKEPKVKAASITTNSVNFNYPGKAYDVAYTYQPKTNDYARSEGGKPHNSIDKAGNLVRNTPKVVIALVIPYSVESDGYHSSYKTIGTGSAFVFQNGAVIKGTWSKDSRQAPFVLKTENGAAIKLNPGQAWISILGNSTDVIYK